MNWAKTYKAAFGRRLDDDDVKEWERLLDGSFRKGADRSWEDEIVGALEAISEQQRSSGRARHPPDFGEVKTAIIRARWANRRDDEPPPPSDADREPDCPFCRDSGAMNWYPEIKAPYPAFGPAWIEKVRIEQIYCVCRRGIAKAQEDRFNANKLSHRQAQEEAKAQFRAIHGAPKEAATGQPEWYRREA